MQDNHKHREAREAKARVWAIGEDGEWDEYRHHEADEGTDESPEYRTHAEGPLWAVMGYGEAEEARLLWVWADDEAERDEIARDLRRSA